MQGSELAVALIGWGATLWDTYCRWHAEKGYWPDETPSGEVKKNA